MFYPEYDREVFRNQDLFYLLRAYILYHTGQVIHPKKISEDLKAIFPSCGFKPSDITIKRYLKQMKDSGEVIFLEREYVKGDSSSQSTSARMGYMYYLSHPQETLEEIIGSTEFKRIAEYYDPNFEYEPDIKRMLRQTWICQWLLKQGYDVKAGIIIFHYFGEDRKDHKVTVPADFIVKNGDKKTVLIVSSSTSLLASHGVEADVHLLNAVLSIKRYAKIPVQFVTLWDKEPTDQAYVMDRLAVEKAEYPIVSWQDINIP